MGFRSRHFRDRADAGAQLAVALAALALDRPVVLGIPRGGVVVSDQVARALGADHGVIVARKLGAPWQPELAIGAVSATGVTYVDPVISAEAGVSDEYLRDEVAAKTEAARRYEDAFDGRRRPSLAGREVIVVDDGLATGSTAIAAVRSVRAEGAKRVILAVPIGPPSTVQVLRREADAVVCLVEEPSFFAVGQFYRDFAPVEDEEVRRLMNGDASA